MEPLKRFLLWQQREEEAAGCLKAAGSTPRLLWWEKPQAFTSFGFSFQMDVVLNDICAV